MTTQLAGTNQRSVPSAPAQPDAIHELTHRLDQARLTIPIGYSISFLDKIFG